MSRIKCTIGSRFEPNKLTRRLGLEPLKDASVSRRSEGLELALDDFLEWFETSRDQPELDPLVRAGVAHFWFVTLHPFDDGNGRLTRAITDLALAQGEHQAIRFYAMSASILEDRAGYYQALETSQKASLDITDWLEWFLKTLLRSVQQAMARIDRVVDKSRFWQQHRDLALSGEQIKVLNRLLDGGERGFEHGINAAQYQAVAKVSKATATRHLTDLLEKTAWCDCPVEAAVHAIKSISPAIERPHSFARLFAQNPHVC